ncbi:MAG: alpha/beta hydrolase [Nonlabens sp.]|uniref:alpha/beta hydrolase n=1 Tax=Nonlabens sp. TaxID=1888209 RepID=UPI003EFACB46
MIKTVSYQHTNSYEILNPIQDSTENIWVCFHGLGYLATYFKRYFTGMDATKNAVIVLQAPSKFYQGTNFKHVGASWLTRVDTAQEMLNNLNYIDAVFKNESLINDPRIVLMGYSQGVSITMRYLIHYNKSVKALIMHSGSIPHEFNEIDGNTFRDLASRSIHISGKRDEYVTADLILRENLKIKELFGTECELHRPDIKHEVDTQLLVEISKTL